MSIGGLSFETKRKALRKAGTDNALFSWPVCVSPAVTCQACAKFGEVVTVRRWVRGAPRRADVSFSSAEEMEAAIQGMEGKDSWSCVPDMLRVEVAETGQGGSGG